MIHHARIFCAVALLAFAFAGGAEAKIEVFKADPYGRFSRAATDDPLASQNVEIKKVEFEDLPEFLRDFNTRLASFCGDYAVNPVSIPAWSYVSDWNRKNNLPPNYFMDLSVFKDLPPTNRCMFGRICERGACFVVGYTARENEVFDLSLKIRVSAWEFFTPEDADPKTTRPVLRLVHADGERCLGSRGCKSEFVWAAKGMASVADSTLIPIEAPEEIEPIHVDTEAPVQ